MRMTTIGAALAATAAIQLGAFTVASAIADESDSTDFQLDCPDSPVVGGDITYSEVPLALEPSSDSAPTAEEAPAEQTEQLVESDVMGDAPIPADPIVQQEVVDSGTALTSVLDTGGDEVATVEYEHVAGEWRPESIAWCAS